jgi:hypothetical protein
LNRSALARVATRALGNPGVERIFARLTARRLRVLAYHRIADPAAFARQLDHLAERYALVSGSTVSRFAYGLASVLRKARLTTGTEVLGTFVGGDQSHLVTPWDGNSLRWRTDPRSGYSYDAASLASADAPNGVAYRVRSVRGLRLLFPVATWGSALDQRVLLGAVARVHAAIGVLGPTGEGAARAPWRPLLRRGQSLLCVWDRVDDRGLPSSPLLRSSWALSAADLEGVI